MMDISSLGMGGYSGQSNCPKGQSWLNLCYLFAAARATENYHQLPGALAGKYHNAGGICEVVGAKPPFSF